MAKYTVAASCLNASWFDYEAGEPVHDGINNSAMLTMSYADAAGGGPQSSVLGSVEGTMLMILSMTLLMRRVDCDNAGGDADGIGDDDDDDDDDDGDGDGDDDHYDQGEKY